MIEGRVPGTRFMFAFGLHDIARAEAFAAPLRECDVAGLETIGNTNAERQAAEAEYNTWQFRTDDPTPKDDFEARFCRGLPLRVPVRLTDICNEGPEYTAHMASEAASDEYQAALTFYSPNDILRSLLLARERACVVSYLGRERKVVGQLLDIAAEQPYARRTIGAAAGLAHTALEAAMNAKGYPTNTFFIGATHLGYSGKVQAGLRADRNAAPSPGLVNRLLLDDIADEVKMQQQTDDLWTPTLQRQAMVIERLSDGEVTAILDAIQRVKDTERLDTIRASTAQILQSAGMYPQ